MHAKQQPIGICDLCLSPIPRDKWYTRRGPRLYCPDTDCRNTANSRAGAQIRAEEQREHVRRGEWQNPAKLHPPTGEEQARRSRLGRLREVASGLWRNPALTPAAREKLSRPRKHSGALHRAIEKLRRGKISDLNDEERDAYHAYQRELRRGKKRVDKAGDDHGIANDYLILVTCESCGNDEYFDPGSMPGGLEHCPYCSECGALLPEQKARENVVDKPRRTMLG